MTTLSDGKSLKRKQFVVSTFLTTITELQQNEDFLSLTSNFSHLPTLVKEVLEEVREGRLDVSEASDVLHEALDTVQRLRPDDCVVRSAAHFCQKRIVENINYTSSNELFTEFLDPAPSFSKKQTKTRHSCRNQPNNTISVQHHLVELCRSLFLETTPLTLLPNIEKDLASIRILPVWQTLRERGLHLDKTVEKLQESEVDSWSDVMESIVYEFWEQLDVKCFQTGSDLQFRKQCEEFLNALLLVLQKVFDMKPEEQTVGNTDGRLPASILANQEPYLDCEWKKEPAFKRPYENIRDYCFLEQEQEVASMLQTKKEDGLSEDFFSYNQSFGLEYLREVEQCLIQAVKEGRVLKADEDVKEMDTWGMDCYSRRNIYDAILEIGFQLEDISIWFQKVLNPTINQQERDGWNLGRSLDSILGRFGDGSKEWRMALAVKKRLEAVGDDYFRVHPKGSGMICQREDGIRAFTLVEEYLGVLHSPWRWFEIQDFLKKRTSDQLPDFYNIMLERPKDDPDGYQVSFVDAAAKGTLASRISHSCEPNCQVVVVSVNGRLTIAMYTTRDIQKGEELSFDYSSVTESEKEYRLAICLCASSHCRGSYLHFAGSGAFMHVMSSRHNFLHRNSILLRSADEPLLPTDHQILQSYGLKDACLGTVGVDRVPSWLEKWTSLILQYVETEFEELPKALIKEGCPSEDAQTQAKGLRDNRLQNLVITIDKIRMCLKQGSQSDGVPLKRLKDEEILKHLWTGEKSIIKRFIRAFLEVSSSRSAGTDWTQDLAQLRKVAQKSALAASIGLILSEKVKTLSQARHQLFEVEKALRSEECTKWTQMPDHNHTAAADILHMYAATQVFFTPGSKHKGFTSSPINIHLDSISGVNQAKGSDGSILEKALKEPVSKKYGAHFIWGQLVMWYKQTVNDPTASLSAERRGTLSLPDIESCYSRGYTHYITKERRNLLEQLENRPDGMWKVGTIFSFRNEMKVYGSPMLDSILLMENNLATLLKHLQAIKLNSR